MSGVECLNVMNLIAFLLNAVFVWGFGVFGLLDLPNNADLSRKYQTLITPAGWTFSIWLLIFVSQALFVLAQLFVSRYKKSGFVLRGVAWLYVYACFLQAGWAIAFAYEIIWLTMLLMALLCACLVKIVINNVSIEYDDTLSYWLMVFPFQIHCGWILAATALNANVVIVDEEMDNQRLQLTAAIVSLVAIQVSATISLFSCMIPQRVIGLVIIWAAIGIKYELDSRPGNISGFDELITEALAGAASGVAIITAGLIIACELIHYYYYSLDKKAGVVGNNNNGGYADDGYDDRSQPY